MADKDTSIERQTCLNNAGRVLEASHSDATTILAMADEFYHWLQQPRPAYKPPQPQVNVKATLEQLEALKEELGSEVTQAALGCTSLNEWLKGHHTTPEAVLVLEGAKRVMALVGPALEHKEEAQDGAGT